jgi:hypothetical protein
MAAVRRNKSGLGAHFTHSFAQPNSHKHQKGGIFHHAKSRKSAPGQIR